MIISLTGFMGCGKSSVGRELSQLLCCPFIDLDQVIQERTGRTIPEIFATEGEAAFRMLEREALKDITCSVPDESYSCHSDRSEGTSFAVLALGGGAIMTVENEKYIHEKTTCIYLKASVETLIIHLESEVDKRPLLADKDLRERIETLMAQRSETYERTAHLIIDVDGKDISEIATEIINSSLIR